MRDLVSLQIFSNLRIHAHENAVNSTYYEKWLILQLRDPMEFHFFMTELYFSPSNYTSLIFRSSRKCTKKVIRKINLLAVFKIQMNSNKGLFKKKDTMRFVIVVHLMA